MDKDILLSIPSRCETVKSTGKFDTEGSGHDMYSPEGMHRIAQEWWDDLPIVRFDPIFS
jgi:hypothetical protein